MGLILSLQGGMAVGKTTAAGYLAAHEPRVHVMFEDISAPAAEVRRRGLDKHRFEDYLEIQRLFIQNELDRWQTARRYPCAVTDLGAQEIEFYTLYYPVSIGQDWPVAAALATELTALRHCAARRTLYLEASPAVLRARKEGDATRDRGFFDHTVRNLLPAKRAWFAALPTTDFLDTSRMSAEQAGAAVQAWVDRQLSLEQ